MNENIPADVLTSFRNRQALLWLCQRYELKDGEVTHQLDRHPNEVSSSYRDNISELDLRLANIFWEAIWTDSVKGVLLSAIEELNHSSGNPNVRRPIILAADPDQEGQVDTRQLLPMYFINGLLDHKEDGSRYDGTFTLRRISYRTNSLRKIEDYPNRCLMILGASSKDDLTTVFDALSSFSPIGMKVFIVWPTANEAIDIPKNIKVPTTIWYGTVESFVFELQKLEAPHAGFIPKYTLRTTTGLISLEESELFGIQDYFNIIFDNDLITPNPNSISQSTFEEFINGTENNWLGYAAELAYKRKYKPLRDSKKDLTEYINNEIASIQSQNDTSNLTITIPARAGSGVTTLIRQTAFDLAFQGTPALLLKQDQVAFNFEALAAFLNQTQQKAGRNVPVVICFDSEHEFIFETYEVAQLLGARGRPAIVIRVESSFDTMNNQGSSEKKDTNLHVRGRHHRLQSIISQISAKEVAEVRAHFESVSRKYSLNLEIPELEEWIEYQNAQKFTSVDSRESSESLFWVALHFLLFSRDLPPEEFDAWIKRVFDSLPKLRYRDLVKQVAVLSSFRLITPLIPLLRSFGHGTVYSNDVIELLRDLDEKTNLITWDAYPEALEDQAIRFKHPLIAQKLLALTDSTIANYPVQVIWPLIASLKAGGKSDVWLAENLAFQFLRTERRPGSNIPYLDLRLETFRRIPPQISEYNKAILHHWARALYHAALENQDVEISKEYLQDAIDKIEKAIALPPRPDRDEHPGHLYTTLGTIYYEVYKRQTLEQRQQLSLEKFWSRSEECFKKAMTMLPDSYQTLAAYSFRLIERAYGKKENNEKEAVDLALEALALLEQAEDVLITSNELDDSEKFFLNDQRRKAWNVIDPYTSSHFIEELIENNEEIGHLLLAQSEIKKVNDLYSLKTNAEIRIIEKAIRILKEFFDKPQNIITWRTPSLLYRLYNYHPKLKYAFKDKLKILRRLERTDYKWHIRMRFDYAVICYQNDLFPEGERKFREIRAILRQPNQPAKVFRDFWRMPDSSEKPRLTVMHVRRKDSDWRGHCFVQDIGQEIPFRPRHFEVPPKIGEYRPCNIVFQTWGPIAVPKTSSGE